MIRPTSREAVFDPRFLADLTFRIRTYRKRALRVVRLVAAEMERPQPLVWPNPLRANPGYAPLTRGMTAALPFVHDLLPVNDLFSVRALAEQLRHLDPVRSQGTQTSQLVSPCDARSASSNHSP